MTIDYELLGKRILQLRKSKNWTQEKLAEKSDLSNNYISNIENSYSIPSLETLMKLCSALDTTPDAILLGTKIDTRDYLNDDISERISLCTPKQKRFILAMIDRLQKEELR